MRPRYIHATAVLIGGKGLLIRGPSRAGKSTLALDLLERGKAFSAMLISDDRVEIVNVAGTLQMRGHPLIAGKIEKRGATPLDSEILNMPFVASGTAQYVIDLSNGRGSPALSRVCLCRIELPRIELPRDGFDRAGWIMENLLDEPHRGSSASTPPGANSYRQTA